MINHMGSVVTPRMIGFTDKEVPPVGDEDVLIRIKSSSICGSDLHIFDDKHPVARLPVTIGHEFSGEVLETGGKVNGCKTGDRVCVEPVVVCGHCDACRSGSYGYCENISFTYRRGDGAMAQYFVANQKYVHHLPDFMSYDAGSLLEPLSVAVHAVRRADVKLGDSVLILGAGAIGVLIGALCKNMGASHIIITDFSDFRLGKAAEMGATHTVNAGRDNLGDVIASLSKGKGVDRAFECVGNPATLSQGISCLRANGTLTVVGLFHDETIPVPMTKIVTRELRVVGTQGYCWDFPIAIQMARHIDLEKMITHRFPLNELQQAIETAANRNTDVMKVVIHP